MVIKIKDSVFVAPTGVGRKHKELSIADVRQYNKSGYTVFLKGEIDGKEVITEPIFIHKDGKITTLSPNRDGEYCEFIRT